MNPLAIHRTPSANDAPLSIRQILARGLAQAPAQEIVYADRARYTYTTLAARVGHLASALTALGVKPGSTVAMMDWDSHRYLECFFAVPMMGAVLHTVNVRISPDQILYTINHAADDVILVNAEFLPILEAIQTRSGRGSSSCSSTTGRPRRSRSSRSTRNTRRCSPPRRRRSRFPTCPRTRGPRRSTRRAPPACPRACITATASSCCTRSAPARRSASAPHATFTKQDVYMPVTPMFHVHAWGLPYVATMLGVKQVYPGRYLPDVLLGLIAREKVTFSHCVPTILSMMLGSPALREGQLKGWKVIIGGSALPLPLARAAVEKGIDVIAGYGMSETCPILTLAHLRPHMRDWDVERKLPVLCRAGRPIPFVQLRIVDANMNDVAHDGVSQGEVVVRSPWLTQGYLNEPEKSEELWLGGWLHTGDVGVIDNEGYLKIVDRIKDVVKTGGEWVSSLDIEDLVLRMPGIAEVAVVGVPDERWGERPVCFVVCKAVPDVQAERGRDPQARAGIRRARRDLEVRGARSRVFRRRDSEDERRQARQEGHPRAPRRIRAR